MSQFLTRLGGLGSFLGALEKLRKANVSFVVSICLSEWKN